jgi:hypothetical protein
MIAPDDDIGARHAARARWPGGEALSAGAFAVFWALLLAGTLAWYLPLMLWDHIDLVPMLEAWHAGTLRDSGFWRVHDGSHFHVAAYAVLLATTTLSDGRPWLDALASFALLTVQALLLWRITRGDGSRSAAGAWALLLVYLALYPGHLVNLQWGWQVAVFISTLGAVAAIAGLTRAQLPMSINLLAVASAGIGVLGFSTTLAVFPVALWLVLSHSGVPRARRPWLALPWAVAGLALAASLAMAREPGAAAIPAPGAWLGYVINYLGGGVSRFATAMAPAWAVIALATAAWTVVRHWQPALRPWLALMAFGAGCAALTAAGRAGEFGAAHAFVTRYASFSSLFWFGWTGLMLVAWRDRPQPWRRIVRPLLLLLALFALANGLHLAKQAREVHARAASYAAHIRTHYPDVDPAILAAAYDWRAEQAHAHLGVLRRRGFAPFHGPGEQSGVSE